LVVQLSWAFRPNFGLQAFAKTKDKTKNIANALIFINP